MDSTIRIILLAFIFGFATACAPSGKDGGTAVIDRGALQGAPAAEMAEPGAGAEAAEAPEAEEEEELEGAEMEADEDEDEADEEEMDAAHEEDEDEEEEEV